MPGPTSLPPRPVIRTIWRAHRTVVRVSRGRLGLRRPRPDRAGFLRLRTTGRRTGAERGVVLCYLADGDALVTLAMNGWSADDPAWWHNLRATPDAEVDLVDGSHRVRARTATPDERDRLLPLMTASGGWGDVTAFTAVRGRDSDVVVLEPRA